MKLNKKWLEKLGQAALNEYVDEPWFKDHKCIYDPNIFSNREKFYFGIDEGTFYTFNDTAIVSTRGTKNFAGWKSNFKFTLITDKIETKAKVEEGFRDGWKSIRPYVYEKTRDFKKIIFIGHSRGSSISTIGAENLSFDFPEKDITLFALSSPMAGNAEFVQLVDARIPDIYRIWYGTDPVVKVPPWCLGYRHVHGGIWLHGNNLLPWYWPGLAISAVGDITGLPFGWPWSHYPDRVLQAIKDAKDL